MVGGEVRERSGRLGDAAQVERGPATRAGEERRPRERAHEQLELVGTGRSERHGDVAEDLRVDTAETDEDERPEAQVPAAADDHLRRRRLLHHPLDDVSGGSERRGHAPERVPQGVLALQVERDTARVRLVHEPERLEHDRVAEALLACALVFTGLTLTVPILVQHAIDDAIDAPDHHLLIPYLGAIVGVAAVRLAVNFTRRYATARVGIAVEARLRGLLYSAYLRYPRAFYDRHATGEVISRATNDIYPVRYFIGWGVVQGVQSAMMITGAAVVLCIVNWRLAVLAALTMPPIAALTWLFAHRVFPISRKVQERKGHLTEASDEAVVGIEMVQAFGREDDVRDRFGGRAEAVRTETMNQAGVEARFLPGLLFLPTLGIAAVLGLGGRDVIHGSLTIGQFTLFITLLLQLVWPLFPAQWDPKLGIHVT